MGPASGSQGGVSKSARGDIVPDCGLPILSYAAGPHGCVLRRKLHKDSTIAALPSEVKVSLWLFYNTNVALRSQRRQRRHGLFAAPPMEIGKELRRVRAEIDPGVESERQPFLRWKSRMKLARASTASTVTAL